MRRASRRSRACARNGCPRDLPDDAYPGCRCGAGRLRDHACPANCHANGGRLGEQPAAGEPPFLGLFLLELAPTPLLLEPLAPLTGDLVDREPAPLRLGMGGNQLSEASRDWGVGDGSRSVSLAHRQLLASENLSPATLLPAVERF
jgi:hypothetical protein